MSVLSSVKTNNGGMKVSSGGYKIWQQMKRDKYLYLLLLPVLINFIIFHYLPYFGIQIAFKQFDLVRGIWDSPWVGLQNFQRFFSTYYVGTIIKNTLQISIITIIVGFPIPICFSLMLNEIRTKRYKSFVQTVSYLPHFISTVVAVSMFTMMLSMDTGIINRFIQALGGEPIYFMGKTEYFIPVYLVFEIWRWTGFDAIIYVAAITSIDLALYDSAEIDGAGRIAKIWHITLSSIKPTIIIMFILRLGSIMSVDWQTIFLMSNPLNESVADVIQTFVYKRAFETQDFSFATAVGLFESLIGFFMVLAANKISKSVGETYIF